MEKEVGWMLHMLIRGEEKPQQRRRRQNWSRYGTWVRVRVLGDIIKVKYQLSVQHPLKHYTI